jgi:hypothetical protein
MVSSVVCISGEASSFFFAGISDRLYTGCVLYEASRRPSCCDYFFFLLSGGWYVVGESKAKIKVETPAKLNAGEKRERRGKGQSEAKMREKAKNHNRAKSGSGFQRSSLGERRSEVEPKNEALFRTTD